MDPADVNKDQNSSNFMDIIEDTETVKAKDINWKAYENFKTALKCFPSAEQEEKAIQHVFNSIPSAETEIENSSIYRSVPVAADVLLSMMLDTVRQI